MYAVLWVPHWSHLDSGDYKEDTQEYVFFILWLWMYTPEVGTVFRKFWL